MIEGIGRILCGGVGEVRVERGGGGTGVTQQGLDMT